MARKSKTQPDKFKFMTERTIKREKYELTEWLSAKLRSKLPKGIYWVQLEKGMMIQWNWTLLQSFLLNGDCPQTQALVDEYMSTLCHTV